MINETTGTLQAFCVGRTSMVTFHRMTTHGRAPAVYISAENDIVINNSATTTYGLACFPACELFLSSEKNTVGLYFRTESTDCSFGIKRASYGDVQKIFCHQVIQNLGITGRSFSLYASDMCHFFIFNIGA